MKVSVQLILYVMTDCLPNPTKMDLPIICAASSLKSSPKPFTVFLLGADNDGILGVGGPPGGGGEPEGPKALYHVY